MRDKRRSEGERVFEVEDSTVLVESIRSLPRMKPRLGFRARVTFYSLMGITPRMGSRIVASGRASRPARVLAAVGAALLIALASFWGLGILANGAMPDSALYALKRANENIDMAFTWSPTEKARKNLRLAERRLEELENVIRAKNTNPEAVARLSSEVEGYQQAAGSVLAGGSSEAQAQLVGSGIEELDKKKADLKKRMVSAAGDEGVLEPASAAGVTVSDMTGGVTVSGSRSASGKTDTSGRFIFEYTPEGSEPDADGALQIEVELDGRRQVAPLGTPDGPVKTEDGSFVVTPSSRLAFAAPGRVMDFDLKLSSGLGESVAGRKLKITDLSHAGLVNGSGSSAVVPTGADGTCAFTFKNTSDRKTSRLAVAVLDGTVWKDAGEAIVVGSVSGGGSSGACGPFFDIQCVPGVDQLGADAKEVTVTVRKMYERLTDYID